MRRSSPAPGPRCPWCPGTGTPPGTASAVQSSPVSWARWVVRSPALTRPRTGQVALWRRPSPPAPRRRSCSAMTCRVLVLPVPVAPATRPWRFIIASGCGSARGSTTPSTTTEPVPAPPRSWCSRRRSAGRESPPIRPSWHLLLRQYVKVGMAKDTTWRCAAPTGGTAPGTGVRLPGGSLCGRIGVDRPGDDRAGPRAGPH